MAESTSPAPPAFHVAGQQVYHVARDPGRAARGALMDWHYSLRPNIIAEHHPEHVFDVRDLPDWKEGADHGQVTYQAIWSEALVSVTGDAITL